MSDFIRRWRQDVASLGTPKLDLEGALANMQALRRAQQDYVNADKRMGLEEEEEKRKAQLHPESLRQQRATSDALEYKNRRAPDADALADETARLGNAMTSEQAEGLRQTRTIRDTEQANEVYDRAADTAAVGIADMPDEEAIPAITARARSLLWERGVEQTPEEIQKQAAAIARVVDKERRTRLSHTGSAGGDTLKLAESYRKMADNLTNSSNKNLESYLRRAGIDANLAQSMVGSARTYMEPIMVAANDLQSGISSETGKKLTTGQREEHRRRLTSAGITVRPGPERDTVEGNVGKAAFQGWLKLSPGNRVAAGIDEEVLARWQSDMMLAKQYRDAYQRASSEAEGRMIPASKPADDRMPDGDADVAAATPAPPAPASAPAKGRKRREPAPAPAKPVPRVTLPAVDVNEGDMEWRDRDYTDEQLRKLGFAELPGTPYLSNGNLIWDPANKRMGKKK